jgi:uncharacterized membrane protein HdeD (DUF308 family)
MTHLELTGPGTRETPASPGSADDSARLRLYLIRGAVALAWAASFAAADESLTTGLALLLVAYPLIDVIASLIDAQSGHDRSAERLQRLNAATSALAAVALAIAATGTISDVLHVFGVWAVVSGVSQIVVALRRRGPATGAQWPMLAAGTLSALAGVFYNLADAEPDNLAVYATGGGIWFLIQAGLMARRHRPHP